MKEDKTKIAVLIDADNAQVTLIKEIIEEVSKYGKATIRRIYGDWTIPQMNNWKTILNTYSLSPIQKFTYTTGKNSTDSSLIIDAMDILHAMNVDGFCIVSSDSDFTGLAKRIREEGMFVMGIGKKTTPIAFVNSCEIFTFTENLVDIKPIIIENKVEAIAVTKQPKSKTAKSEVQNKALFKNQLIPLKDIIKIDKAFEIASEGETQTYISKLGLALRKIDPSFDPRTFGFKNLTQLFGNLEKYEIINNEHNGLNHPLLKIK